MYETIKMVLMRRDGMTSDEADNLIDDAIDEMNYLLMNCEDCSDICEEYFGLEPDYLMELI